MTREEAIEFIAQSVKSDVDMAKVADAIEALEQETFINKPCCISYVNELMAKHNIDYVNGDDEDKVRTFAIDLIHSCMNVIKTAPTIIEVDRYDIDKNNVHIIKEI